MKVGSLNLYRDATTKASSAGLDTGLPLRLCNVPYLGSGGCLHRGGRKLSKAQGPPLVRRRAALLTAAQDRDDVDIVRIKRECAHSLRNEVNVDNVVGVQAER